MRRHTRLRIWHQMNTCSSRNVCASVHNVVSGTRRPRQVMQLPITMRYAQAYTTSDLAPNEHLQLQECLCQRAQRGVWYEASATSNATADYHELCAGIHDFGSGTK